MAKKKTAKENNSSAPKKNASEIEILDMNPAECPYKNPANMRYVEARETKDGKIICEGIMLLTNDHIARLEA